VFHLPTIAGTTKCLGICPDVSATAHNWKDMIKNKFFGGFTPFALWFNPLGFLLFRENEVMPWQILKIIPRFILSIFAMCEHDGSIDSPSLSESRRHLGARFWSVLEDTLLRARAFGWIQFHAFRNSLACFWGMSLAVVRIFFACDVNCSAFNAAKQFRIRANMACSPMNEFATLQTGKIPAGLFISQWINLKTG
jgi:hypothetical protein